MLTADEKAQLEALRSEGIDVGGRTVRYSLPELIHLLALTRLIARQEQGATETVASVGDVFAEAHRDLVLEYGRA